MSENSMQEELRALRDAVERLEKRYQEQLAQEEGVNGEAFAKGFKDQLDRNAPGFWEKVRAYVANQEPRPRRKKVAS